MVVVAPERTALKIKQNKSQKRAKQLLDLEPPGLKTMIQSQRNLGDGQKGMEPLITHLGAASAGGVATPGYRPQVTLRGSWGRAVFSPVSRLFVAGSFLIGKFSTD